VLIVEPGKVYPNASKPGTLGRSGKAGRTGSGAGIGIGIGAGAGAGLGAGGYSG